MQVIQSLLEKVSHPASDSQWPKFPYLAPFSLLAASSLPPPTLSPGLCPQKHRLLKLEGPPRVLELGGSQTLFTEGDTEAQGGKGTKGHIHSCLAPRTKPAVLTKLSDPPSTLQGQSTKQLLVVLPLQLPPPPPQKKNGAGLHFSTDESWVLSKYGGGIQGIPSRSWARPEVTQLWARVGSCM